MKLQIQQTEGEPIGEVHENFEFEADIPLQHKERIRALIRSAKKFKVDTGPLERHTEDDGVPITPGEAMTTFDGEEALPRLKMAIDRLTPYHAELIEEEDIALKCVEDPEEAPDGVEVREGPPGFCYYTVSKDEEPADGEMLEIRDYYRVWVRDQESVPDDQMALYDEEGDPAGNHWYYEIPFETSTRIDLSDKSVNPDEVIEKGDTDLTPRELSDFGVSDSDQNLFERTQAAIEDDDPILEAPRDTLKAVDSPVTLLALYKTCHEADGYDGALGPIQNELKRRKVTAVDKITRKRRTFGHGTSENVSLEKEDDVLRFTRD
jgi:hypothetical protein